MQMQLDFAVIALSDYDEDGHLQAQTDSPGEEDVEGVAKAGTSPAEVLLPLGFHARALDPDKSETGDVGLGCSALTVTGGSSRYLLPLGDPRDVPKLPKLRKGGRMMEGGAGDYRSFIMIYGLDPSGVDVPGSMMISVPYALDGAKAQIGLSLIVRKPGEEMVSLLHGCGSKFTLSAKGSKPVQMMNSDASCWIQTDDEGNTIAGDTHIQGSCVFGDVSATGVATQLSMLPLFTAFQAFLTAFQALNLAATTTTPALAFTNLGPALTTAMTVLQAVMALPTTFSMKVKASM